MSQIGPTFQCIVICPSGKVLDCQANSVIFPSHDGQVGILANHMPMFCTLGLGIMEVKHDGRSTSMIVDGGFAVVCQNLLKLVSYDVIIPSDMTKQAIDQLCAALRKQLQAKITPEQRTNLTKKLALIRKIGALSHLPAH